MKRFFFSVSLFLVPACMIAFIAEAANSGQTIDMNLIRRAYGPDISRVYRQVAGMPRFAFDSQPLPVLRYRKDKSACNELFLRENPEMAEECNKTRETVSLANRYQKKLTVHILDGKINSIDFNIPLNERDSSKSRKVILLQDSLIVHDIVMERYSHNHAKIYFFPTGTPRVELDSAHNLIVAIGADDYVKFLADDFRKTECRGFAWSARTKFYRNGSRSVPDIDYRGDQPYMTTVNWSYPPLDGFLDLYNHSQKVGRLPASLLFQKCKDQRAKPLFTDTGLLNYLKRMHSEESVKKHYGLEIPRFIEMLLN